MTKSYTKADALLLAVLETVLEAGKDGAPGGPLYAALMSTGITYEGFTNLQAILERYGLVKVRNHVWYATPKALKLIPGQSPKESVQ